MYVGLYVCPFVTCLHNYVYEFHVLRACLLTLPSCTVCDKGDVTKVM